MALEPSQVRKEAALRDAHQVPLLTDDALLYRCGNFRVSSKFAGAQGLQKRRQLLDAAEPTLALVEVERYWLINSISGMVNSPACVAQIRTKRPVLPVGKTTVVGFPTVPLTS
jgi:hypothetical protein